MRVVGLNKILRSKDLNDSGFFFFFTILLNIRLIFIINNFVFNSPLASKVISVILIFGFLYYLPFFLKILKNKSVLIIFILMNILGIYYSIGRYTDLVNPNHYAITLYLKNIPMPFLIGITSAYLSFQERLKENMTIILITCLSLVLYIYAVYLGGIEWGTGGLLRGADAADALFQTVGFYTVVTVMPAWLYIKMNYFKYPPKVLNKYKNIFTIFMLSLLAMNFMCGSKKDLVILLSILILNYIDDFNFIRNFSFKIKKYYIFNYIIGALTFYLLSRNDDIGDNSIFFYELFVVRLRKSIVNRIGVIVDLFSQQVKDTFPFGDPTIMDPLEYSIEPYIHSSIINVLLTCGVIGLIIWLYITLNTLFNTFKFSTALGFLFLVVVLVSMVATAFDWQLFWYFIGLTCGLTYLKKSQKRILYT